MAVTAHRKPARLSIELFRAFYASRPDEERWQLIDGAAVMMTPPTPAHQRIASNLERLLNDALDGHAPSLTAYQRLGLNVSPSVEHYDPEPDVVIVDANVTDDPAKRYMDRFYLAAEIVSASDRLWVEKKCDIYKLHENCKCVLTVQQDRCEIRIDSRSEGGWSRLVLTKSEDVLVLHDFGLRCQLADLYRGTSLHPRSHGAPKS